MSSSNSFGTLKTLLAVPGIKASLMPYKWNCLLSFAICREFQEECLNGGLTVTCAWLQSLYQAISISCLLTF